MLSRRRARLVWVDFDKQNQQFLSAIYSEPEPVYIPAGDVAMCCFVFTCYFARKFFQLKAGSSMFRTLRRRSPAIRLAPLKLGLFAPAINLL
uniref:Uncharacterized protein n=1 Tax=mine drainage metagenome TaxID=410659 RepID=E6QW56_9ZZZZ